MKDPEFDKLQQLMLEFSQIFAPLPGWYAGAGALDSLRRETRITWAARHRVQTGSSRPFSVFHYLVRSTTDHRVQRSTRELPRAPAPPSSTVRSVSL